jgi:SAM-dependent methyltransferase
VPRADHTGGKSASFHYWNADISLVLSDAVDFQVTNGKIDGAPGGAQVALLSFILSMIRKSRERVCLLRELYRLTDPGGRLILFDDIDLRRKTISIPHGAFFHELRLGQDLLGELAAAKWFPVVVSAVPQQSIGVELDSPFILAAKQRSDAKLTEVGNRLSFAPFF